MKIYTKTGDKGTTGLIGGTRVPKHHLRIEAYGTVDELNSYIGLIRDQQIDPEYKHILKEIQDRLFTVGALLASDPEKSKMKVPDLNEADISLLEKQMDLMNEELPELRNFILPGGHTIVSYCHLARCVCRRAERLSVQLAEESVMNELVLKYLNRLSDYLFVLSRKVAADLNAEEYIWVPRTNS
ncbi:cob(I)yrinic acid a,c-diamide adenosyltransferase [Solitalea koreensis]|uniref:Corrinoid adenosyltransferase n=1 Tax=Solitalea koreensis TaxID=543615 RepID=A0A521DE29_9SPHI|nr:cob(I)yrinic acid a,c-diamide adenosyltransferase [Solitalea koreensis]SMO69401.1 cob(I)alamin adenosyltransferase [Solitalea koreensis]